MNQNTVAPFVTNLYGTGIDIQSINELEASINKYGLKFLNKIFTSEEIAYCSNKHKPSQHFAARFSAKEAFLKALGTGIGAGFCLKDVVVLNKDSGEPYLTYCNQVNRVVIEKKLKAFVSLSHSLEYSIAQVILLRDLT
ncbi:holo-ACP synthase [Bacillus cereus]|nr:holo-ACP synthase [Bacillus cereus]